MSSKQNFPEYDEYPIGDSGWRYLCSPEKPAPKYPKGHWEHTGTKSDGGNYEGDADDYICVDCGTTWRVYYEG